MGNVLKLVGNGRTVMVNALNMDQLAMEKCEFDQCAMRDGTCFNINEKSQKWKSCKGKCIKVTSKCDGSCSWGQCEMKDGRCTNLTEKNKTNGKVENILKFGICAGQCVEVLNKLQPLHAMVSVTQSLEQNILKIKDMPL
eukprot:TRINITY_DN8749_c0_g1_i1.p1 TRINITY_DN8749_c0_g1~~TRINITY_DN8749_c0_g1_i1.p1  ORF type:complete len:140 (-),score=14.78 TRINITY_DN8749_c0_g1_i1:108-527(-)